MKNRLMLRKRFVVNLLIICEYIAIDSVRRAINFYNLLLDKLESLFFMPYSYRQSIYYQNYNTRDLIYLGYVIPFFIETKSKIAVLDIIKNRVK